MLYVQSYLSILTSSPVSSLNILINFKVFFFVFCSKCLNIHNILASLRTKEKRKKFCNMVESRNILGKGQEETSQISWWQQLDAFTIRKNWYFYKHPFFFLRHFLFFYTSIFTEPTLWKVGLLLLHMIDELLIWLINQDSQHRKQTIKQTQQHQQKF